MIYLPKHKIVFIHNPKTGGTSIANWLTNNFETVRGRLHGNHLEAQHFFPDATIHFGVVRDPWSRLVSWYKHANDTRTISFKDWLLRNAFAHQPALSFQSNLMWARNWYTLTTTQTEWFNNNTKILRFETLDKDFEYIQDLLGCNIPLPVLNSTTKTDLNYYDAELAELVRDIYLEDVIKYNYEYKV